MKARTLMVVLLILSMSAPALVTAGQGSREDQVDFDIVEDGTQMEYQNKRPDIVIFQNATRFRDFHSRIHRRTVPRPDTPEVDFDTYFVVFITYGEQPSAGYFIQVRSVLRREDTVAIRTLLKEPPQDSMQAQTLTHPYVFVEIPREEFMRIEWSNVTGEVFFSRSLQ
jgi:hypothetical protein